MEKSFPMPQPYKLGGVTARQLVIKIGLDPKNHARVCSRRSALKMRRVTACRCGYPAGLSAGVQCTSPQDWHLDAAFDRAGALRRFVDNLPPVLNQIDWPRTDQILKASASVERTFDQYVKDCNTLNRM